MPYSIQKENSNVIRVRYNHNVELDVRKSAVDEVCELVEVGRPVKLLIDVRNITMKMSLDEQENFGQYLASQAALKNARVAVLCNPQIHPNQIINAVAYSEGYYTVEFDDEEDALAWLNKNTEFLQEFESGIKPVTRTVQQD